MTSGTYRFVVGRQKSCRLTGLAIVKIDNFTSTQMKQNVAFLSGSVGVVFAGSAVCRDTSKSSLYRQSRRRQITPANKKPTTSGHAVRSWTWCHTPNACCVRARPCTSLIDQVLYRPFVRASVREQSLLNTTDILYLSNIFLPNGVTVRTGQP